MRWTALALALVLAASGDAPKVRIKSPRGGWTSQRVATISGSVSDRHVKSVRLSVNGASRTINAHAGHFEARLPVKPGPNTVEASAQNASGSGRDQVSFFASVPQTDLQILLTWDTDGTDLDLHVTEPSGEECYHGNRQTASGGVLEVDDTDGFGPEVYLSPRATLGEYRFAVAYYDAARAAQTEALVEVILREGTPSERRYQFPVTLTHEGEMLEIGSVLVDRPLE
jgi:uncharacterized protein YfaP (DUF2135 family)